MNIIELLILPKKKSRKSWECEHHIRSVYIPTFLEFSVSWTRHSILAPATECFPLLPPQECFQCVVVQIIGTLRQIVPSFVFSVIPPSSFAKLFQVEYYISMDFHLRSAGKQFFHVFSKEKREKTEEHIDSYF